MLHAFRPMGFGLIAAAASALTLNVQPTLAKTCDSETTEITADCLRTFLGLSAYYARYAILAATPNVFPDGTYQDTDQENKPENKPLKDFKDSMIKDILTDAYIDSKRTKEDEREKERVQMQALKSVEGWQFQNVPHARLEPNFQVWAKMNSPLDLFHAGACSEVSIAFGSTRGLRDKYSDWRSLPVVGGFIRFSEKHLIHTDYSLLKQNINTIINDIVHLECYTRSGPNSPPLIVSVGTSLGGGLAEFAAYANANDSVKPRVEKVFSFNTSPEAALDLVKEEYKENRKRLEIDHVQEVAEPLAAAKNAYEEAGYKRREGFSPEDTEDCDPLVRPYWLEQKPPRASSFTFIP
jgi:hypothetical protein